MFFIFGYNHSRLDFREGKNLPQSMFNLTSTLELGRLLYLTMKGGELNVSL